ncbi:MAG: EamA family transporter [Clostridia bacterium]|nr:EamA family transporter [Clostridia bacterium]
MGYLFLAIALLAGATKGYCGKRTSGVLNALSDAVAANLVRMLLCILIGFLVLLFGADLPDLAPTLPLLLLSAVGGVASALFVVSWLLAVRKSAYMLIDIFLMLGVLVPLFGGAFLFEETIRPIQWGGVAVLLVAVFLMSCYNNKIKEPLSVKGLLLLVLCGLSNGIADLSQKAFVKEMPGIAVGAFQFYTYLFAALTLLVALLFVTKGKKENAPHLPARVFAYLGVMAVCLFANSFFKTLAASLLDAVLLYPLNQGASLLLSTAMARVLFKEKLTATGILGIAVAFIGLLMIHFL